ncbi:hypothetical protein C3B55_00868 [Candidatus Pseudomonas adelgestsugas]|uniref:Uncharacterized protein n=1 Tax=Candidatus Pseudomonas adelgestsugas TaxID=1302376 RepID=A0ABX5R9U5_9PSED|nr:hypothetical protein C3B55_00868 [Candidatus Pseudomonas adelgestsugas]
MRDAGVGGPPAEVVITHGCVDALQMSLRVLTHSGDLIAAEVANLLWCIAISRCAWSQGYLDI